MPEPAQPRLWEGSSLKYDRPQSVSFDGVEPEVVFYTPRGSDDIFLHQGYTDGTHHHVSLALTTLGLLAQGKTRAPIELTFGPSEVALSFGTHAKIASRYADLLAQELAAVQAGSLHSFSDTGIPQDELLEGLQTHARNYRRLEGVLRSGTARYVAAARGLVASYEQKGTANRLVPELRTNQALGELSQSLQSGVDHEGVAHTLGDGGCVIYLPPAF